MAEESKEITKMLKSENPRLIPNRVFYNYKLQTYMPQVNVDHVVYHFQQESRLEFVLREQQDRESIEDVSEIKSDSSEVYLEIDNPTPIETTIDMNLDEETSMKVTEEDDPSNIKARLKFFNDERKWRIETNDDVMSDYKDIMHSLSDVPDDTGRRHSDDPVRLQFDEGSTAVQARPNHRRRRKLSFTEAEEENEGDDVEVVKVVVERKIKLIDQSRFCDHGVQTSHCVWMDKSMFTENPVSAEFVCSFDQSEIYDKYVDVILRSDKNIFTEKKNKSKLSRVNTTNLKKLKPPSDNMETKLLGRLRTIERMIFHNLDPSLLVDFSSWEDPADEYRDTPQGSLLPLWRVRCGKVLARRGDLESIKVAARVAARGHTALQLAEAVTAMCWCPRHHDLLVLTFGSRNFTLNRVYGLVYGLSLKNLDVPEFLILTDSGVMCIDIHKHCPNIICVGFFDGTVAVYDMSKATGKNHGLHCSSRGMSSFHIDSVSIIQWFYRYDKRQLGLSITQHLPRPELEFVSAGEDGKIILWKINKDGLGQFQFVVSNLEGWIENIITNPVTDQHGFKVNEPDSITMLDLQPDESSYLLGTTLGRVWHAKMFSELRIEEVPPNAVQFGKVSGAPLIETRLAHTTTITGLNWNPFYREYFLSASLDWTIKIWSEKQPESCMFDLDLESEITAAQWSQHSSTVLGAVTMELEVFVFDLSLSLDSAVCRQRVISSRHIGNTILTSLSFSKANPSLTVASNTGEVRIFKMSPMLRKKPNERKKGSESQKYTHMIVADTLPNVLEKFAI